MVAVGNASVGAFMPVHADGTEPNVVRARLALLGRVDIGGGQPRHDVAEEGLVFLACHAGLELDALDAGSRQAPAPLPLPQIAERTLSIDHLGAKERKPGCGIVALERLQLLEGIVDGLLARGVAVAIQRHRR